MKISIRDIYTMFFFIGWFFFPFNDFEGYSFLGEYKNDAGTYFFLIGFLILIIEIIFKKKISFPYQSYIFKILIVFLLWCIITTLLNSSTLLNSYFKHTSGINRFFRQYISLTLATVILPFLYWNVIKSWTNKQVLIKIRHILLLSLIFVFIYGFIETLIVVFGLGIFRPLLSIFDYFPFLDVNYPPGGRISSVAYESPALGNYLITVSGWMFSYIFTHNKNYKYIPLMMIVFLVFFSGSRTALITVGMQISILLFILARMEQYRSNVLKIFKYSITIIVLLLTINGPKIIREAEKKIESLDFKKNLKNNVSNQSRFGMQYASLQVFKENPIIGVGFGQETYFKRKHYPAWAVRNNYEFKLRYENKNDRSFPTAYNLYTRLLAETGLIGVFILFYLIFYSIKQSLRIWNYTINETKILGFILIISFTGLSLNWMQTDFFRQHGFWLCLMILIKMNYTFKKQI